MIKRMLIMLVFVGVLFGGIFGFEAFRAHMIQKFLAARGQPAQTVSTIKAGRQLWQPHITVVGTLQAQQGADVAPEVSGIVTAIHFKSGQHVEAGTLLLELNTRPDVAKLHSLQATAQLAKTTYERDLKQFRAQAISKATLDAATADLKSARAQVAQQQALINQKMIRAPFTGRLGIRAVDLGEYLKAGAPIVTIQALNPIYVDFYLPQKNINQIQVGQTVSVQTDAFPGRSFVGKISAINPLVDVNTRNVEVRAAIPNPDQLLVPGMFATAQIDIGKPQYHITLPQTAITYQPYGDLVYLVEAHGKGPHGKPRLTVQQQFVTVGDTRGDQVAVLKGVKTGDIVVTAGQIKLRNGAPVTINNSIQPADNPAPQVPNE